MAKDIDQVNPAPISLFDKNADLVQIEKEWHMGLGAAMYVIEKCKCKTHRGAIKYYQREIENYKLGRYEKTVTNTQYLGSNFKRIMQVQISYHQDVLRMFGNKIKKPLNG